MARWRPFRFESGKVNRPESKHRRLFSFIRSLVAVHVGDEDLVGAAPVFFQIVAPAQFARQLPPRWQ